MVISGFGLLLALGFRASGLGPCAHELVVLSRHVRALGGDLCNFDNAATVYIEGVVMAGWREAGPQGARPGVPGVVRRAQMEVEKS